MGRQEVECVYNILREVPGLQLQLCFASSVHVNVKEPQRFRISPSQRVADVETGKLIIF